MSEFLTSADGTRIAYDRAGEGPAIILVGGANQFRALDSTTVALAEMLAQSGLTVVNYDRRGRGESGDTLPFALEREIEDIAALIKIVGGKATLYGSSSGAVLSLWAAEAGIGVEKLVLWEPPLALDNDENDFLEGLQLRVAAGDREGTQEFFMRDMPPEWLKAAKNSPAWPLILSVAPTLVHDATALARAQTGTPWSQQWANVTMPTIIILGEGTLPFFAPAADALVEALPDARRVAISGGEHSWQPEMMAPLLTEFVKG